MGDPGNGKSLEERLNLKQLPKGEGLVNLFPGDAVITTSS